MSSIAMFPCTFTPVAGVVGELANALALRVYTDENLITDTTSRFGIHADKLKMMIFGKTSVFNQFTLERETTVNMFRSVMVDVLDTPHNYLLYGFLSSLISPRITHVLRVLVVDSKQSRIEYAMQEGQPKSEAKRAVRNHDISAFGWTDFLFQKEAYHSSLYDMVIPVQGKKETELFEEIAKYYHRTPILRSTESQRALQDMRLETEVERLLLYNGHKVSVKAVGGDVSLRVQNSVLNFGRLVEELTGLAQQITGVSSVEVGKGNDYSESIYRRQKFELPSKVLFVDDEREFVQTVAQRLISRDVGTYGVYNGEDALGLVAEDCPDVMVLDLKMPGLHGIEVLRKTKELAPEVEVIILTGHGTNSDMEQCMKLGAFAYMNKPVDIEELSETIKAAHTKLQHRFSLSQETAAERVGGAA